MRGIQLTNFLLNKVCLCQLWPDRNKNLTVDLIILIMHKGVAIYIRQADII